MTNYRKWTARRWNRVAKTLVGVRYALMQSRKYDATGATFFALARLEGDLSRAMDRMWNDYQRRYAR